MSLVKVVIDLEESKPVGSEFPKSSAGVTVDLTEDEDAKSIETHVLSVKSDEAVRSPKVKTVEHPRSPTPRNGKRFREETSELSESEDDEQFPVRRYVNGYLSDESVWDYLESVGEDFDTPGVDALFARRKKFLKKYPKYVEGDLSYLEKLVGTKPSV